MFRAYAAARRFGRHVCTYPHLNAMSDHILFGLITDLHAGTVGTAIILFAFTVFFPEAISRRAGRTAARTGCRITDLSVVAARITTYIGRFAALAVMAGFI